MLDRRRFLTLVVQFSIAAGIFSSTTTANAAFKDAFSHVNPNQDEDSPLWPLKLTKTQLDQLKKLIDVILPSHSFQNSEGELLKLKSGGDEELELVDFLNEWVSAPFEKYTKDFLIFAKGFEHLEKVSQEKFKKDFLNVHEEQCQTIIDHLILNKETEPAGYEFFIKLRYLTVGAYYTCEEGLKSLDFKGNEPQYNDNGEPEFFGASQELIDFVISEVKI